MKPEKKNTGLIVIWKIYIEKLINLIFINDIPRIRAHDLGILDVSLDQRVMTPANHPPNN